MKNSTASADAASVSVKEKKKNKNKNKNSLELDFGWRWWQNVNEEVRVLTRKDTCQRAVYPKSLSPSLLQCRNSGYSSVHFSY